PPTVISPRAHGNSMPKPPRWVSAAFPWALGAPPGPPGNPGKRGAAGCILAHSLAVSCRWTLWTLVRPKKSFAAPFLPPLAGADFGATSPKGGAAGRQAAPQARP